MNVNVLDMEVTNKKIWLFSEYLHGSGGTNTVVRKAMEVLSLLRIQYCHASIINSSAKENEEKKKLYFKALPMPVYINNLLAGLKWKRQLRQIPAALVLGGSPISAGIPYAANIPYIMWIGTTFYDEYKVRSIVKETINRNYSLVLNKLFTWLNTMIESCVLKNAQLIIVQSPYTLRTIKEYYKIKEENIEYLPYPVTPKLQIGKKTFNVKGPMLLAVGRVDDNRKNFPLLLDVFSLFVKVFPKSRLRIVGEISYRSMVLKKARRLGISSFVDFLGNINNDELVTEYLKANIFVLSSKQEGLGLVYLEAMSYGLPVVTTKCGGPEGIITDGVNGYLVNQNDPRAFSHTLEKIWGSEELYRKLCIQAYNYILEMHSDEKFRKRFLEIFQTKLGIC